MTTERHPSLTFNRPVEKNPNSPQSRGLKFWVPGIQRSDDYDLITRNSIPSTNGPTPLAGGPAAKFRNFVTGSSQYVETDSFWVSGPPLTLSCWFRTTDAAHTGAIIWTGRAAAANEWCMIRVVSSGIFESWERFGGNTAARAGSSSINADTWYLVTGVFRNASLREIYVNGKLEGTNTNTVTVGTTYDRLSIGRFGDNSPGVYLTGDVADCRVYDRALSANEIWQMYDPRSRWDLIKIPSRFKSFVPVGGTTFFESHGGTLTSSGVLIRETLKPFGGTLSSSGTPTKQTSKTQSGTLTTAGDLIKQVGKVLAGTLTSSGVVDTVKTALISLAGTLTTAGDVVKQTTKTFAGTLTSSGVLVKQAGKVLAGTLTTSGALIKQAGKVLAGTLTTSGVVSSVKTALISLAGTLTTSADVVKQTTKTFAGTLTISGDVVKQTAKSFAGTLTTAADVIKQAGKVLAGTLTTAGAVSAVKTALISLAGTLTTAGDVIKQPAKVLAGTLTTAADVVKQTTKTFVGTITTAGDLVRQAGKSLGGTLTTAGILTSTKTVLMTLVGVLSLSAVVVKQTSKPLTGALTSSGIITRLTNKILSGVLTTAGILAVLSDATVFVFRDLKLRARPIILSLRKRDGRKRDE